MISLVDILFFSFSFLLFLLILVLSELIELGLVFGFNFKIILIIDLLFGKYLKKKGENR